MRISYTKELYKTGEVVVVQHNKHHANLRDGFKQSKFDYHVIIGIKHMIIGYNKIQSFDLVRSFF